VYQSCNRTALGAGHLRPGECLLYMREIVLADRSTVAATVRLAASGDEIAFARLVAEHHPAMPRVAFFIAGDRATADEAVQAAWLNAWRKLAPGDITMLATGEPIFAVRTAARSLLECATNGAPASLGQGLDVPRCRRRRYA
jgi:hypothetical protein